ncbi:leucine/isoleucine/valine transporter permease subunit [Variovorax sp. PBS-H4]|uniref:branched-chain amino acid ABC transporter permease n=1 Tax=Variovorax sp. PBS-H4 TaxID=434008 RepID=UPI0013168188|nr:branched-chain amino acid ABC transporter permease [Variovorax sp. PBS-H4]VTU39924.1 leucine/isoleucine/valine transporter permease subunit [Variovorax sp. PBS-H4]
MNRFSPWASWSTPAIWLLLGLAPLALGEWAQSQLAQFMTYGIFALGLGFLWGHAGVLSFGQAIFFGLGAYSMGLTSLGMVPGIAPSTFNGLLLAFATSGLAAAIFGSMLFYGRGLAGAYFGIVTLCAAVIVETATGRWDFVGGNNGLFGIAPLELPPLLAERIPDSTAQYLLAFGVALGVYALLRWLSRTPFGTVLAAIRDNDRRAAFLGFDVAMHKNIAFVLAAMVSALAGAMFAKFFGFVSPTLIGFSLSTEVLIWVAVGGRGVLMGAFLGAILVRSVESALSERFGNFWLLLLGGVFVVVVVFFPIGVFGRVLALAPPLRLRMGARSTGPGEHLDGAAHQAGLLIHKR